MRLVPVLALAALAAFPGTATADPEDGEGCAGLPDVPAAYVCVISATPANALPSLSGGGSVAVPVPRVCYVAGCTDPTTVSVPVPGATPGSGAVAVLWWNGTYIPIAVGTVPELGPLPVDGDDLSRLLENLGGRLTETVQPVQDALDDIRDIDLAHLLENLVEFVQGRVPDPAFCTTITCD